jgi:hypothetical protein
MALVGCVTAESHGPAEDTTTTEGQLTEADMLGRWVDRASAEVIDLRANGVFVFTAAPVLRASAADGAGTWHLTDFAGTQYLVTVHGGTSAQKTGARGATTLELTPGGTYDLTVAP